MEVIGKTFDMVTRLFNIELNLFGFRFSMYSVFLFVLISLLLIKIIRFIFFD